MTDLYLSDSEEPLDKKIYYKNHDYVKEASWTFSVIKKGIKIKNILLEIGRYGAHYRLSYSGNYQDSCNFIEFAKSICSFYLTKYVSAPELDIEPDEIQSTVEILTKEMYINFIQTNEYKNIYKTIIYFCLKGKRSECEFMICDSFPEDEDLNDFVLDCISFRDTCAIFYSLRLETVDDYNLLEDIDKEKETKDMSNKEDDKLQRISTLQSEILKRDRYIEELEKELVIKDEIIRKQVVMMAEQQH